MFRLENAILKYDLIIVKCNTLIQQKKVTFLLNFYFLWLLQVSAGKDHVYNKIQIQNFQKKHYNSTKKPFSYQTRSGARQTNHSVLSACVSYPTDHQALTLPHQRTQGRSNLPHFQRTQRSPALPYPNNKFAKTSSCSRMVNC